METKTCSKCKIEKNLSEYYKDSHRKSGYVYKCKDCTRIYYRRYRLNNNKIYVSKDKRYYLKNKENISLKRKSWLLNNKDKSKAHYLVKEAIRKGVLKKMDCEKCTDSDTQAHHYDYSRPLDVVWLCKRCHMRLHHGK